jgi:hypothetical protein
VPDSLLDQAISTLLSVGFQSCQGTACAITSARRVSPIPVAHLHLSQSEDGLELFKQSDTLWKLPTLDPSRQLLGPESDIMLASDVSLPPRKIGGGAGPFPRSLYAVHIPTIHRYTEAIILLGLRCRGQFHEAFWSAMLTYIEEYVYDHGRLNVDLLSPSHKRFLLALQVLEAPMKEIRDTLDREYKLEEAHDSGTEQVV